MDLTMKGGTGDLQDLSHKITDILPGGIRLDPDSIVTPAPVLALCSH
jgi:hypothetical protein